MKIQGLQKMTLLDYPEHVAATVFLGGCDFRCPFCHNYELVEGTSLPLRTEFQAPTPPAMDEEEFFKFLAGRKGLLDGVAITGGEPCLRRELPEFAARIKEMGFLVKLDTNGNNPDVLETMMNQRLVDYVAMDIKNSKEKYAETVGLAALDLDPIMKSIGLIMNGGIPYEFRTTVMLEFHDDESIEGIGKLINGAAKHFLQPFVDRDMVPDHSLTAPPQDVLERFRDILVNHVEFCGIRGI